MEENIRIKEEYTNRKIKNKFYLPKRIVNSNKYKNRKYVYEESAWIPNYYMNNLDIAFTSAITQIFTKLLTF